MSYFWRSATHPRNHNLTVAYIFSKTCTSVFGTDLLEKQALVKITEGTVASWLTNSIVATRSASRKVFPFAQKLEKSSQFIKWVTNHYEANNIGDVHEPKGDNAKQCSFNAFSSKSFSGLTFLFTNIRPLVITMQKMADVTKTL